MELCVYVIYKFNRKMFLSISSNITGEELPNGTTISSASSSRSGLDNTVFRISLRAVGYSNAII